MDFSSALLSFSRVVKRPPSRFFVLCVFSLLAYVWLLDRFVCPYVAGADQAGYLNNARLLSRGQVMTHQRVISGLEPARTGTTPWLYTPLGFFPHADEIHLVPTYPTGLSLLTIVTAKVTGWAAAPAWTSGWNMLLGVLLFYQLARLCGLSPHWSYAGTVLLGLSPLYLHMGFQFMSDVPSLTWCTAAVVLSLLSARRPAWAAAAGAAFSLAVLIRPSNSLAIFPVSIALGVAARPWLFFVLGGIPGAAFLVGYNHSAYDAIVTTGYGNMTGAFGWANLAPNLAHYAKWLPLVFTPLAVLALGLPCCWREQPKIVALIAVWASTLLAFYSVYLFTHDAWWYLRFILPAAPPLIIASLLVSRKILHKIKPGFLSSTLVGARGVAAAIVAISAFNLSQAWRLHSFNIKTNERSYIRTARWLKQYAPASAVVSTMQSTGSIFAYTPFPILRWDAITPELASALDQRLTETQQEVYAVLYPFEEKDALARWPGHWGLVYQTGSAKIFLRLHTGSGCP